MAITVSALSRRLALSIASLALIGCATIPLNRRAAEFNSRGAAQLAAGDLEAAEASLQLALEYNDRYAEPYNNLGLVAMTRGRLREARLFFRRAVGLNPDFGEAWSNLGLALVRAAGEGDRGDIDGAIDAFRAALSVNPELIAPRINLCRTLLAARRTREALEQARRSVQMAPSSAAAHALRAEAALSLGIDDEARTAAGEAERLTPFAPDVLLTSARVLASGGRYDDALSRIARIENDPIRGEDARALRTLIARERR